MPAIDDLSRIVAAGLSGSNEELEEKAKRAISGLFGERFRTNTLYRERVALMPGEYNNKNPSFAGLMHSDSPSRGVYGGMSLIWFPIPADDAGPARSLITLVCGTRGLSPDEGIMGRPGHARQLRALARPPVATPVGKPMRV